MMVAGVSRYCSHQYVGNDGDGGASDGVPVSEPRNDEEGFFRVGDCAAKHFANELSGLLRREVENAQSLRNGHAGDGARDLSGLLRGDACETMN